MTDYERIAKAIEFIHGNFQQQPALEDIAKEVFLSPFYFQKLFTDWAGVSPKKFLQYISIEHAKELLKKNITLADASFDTGLSGTGRLHDLFITIEGMTPGEYKNDGEALHIDYSFSQTNFGKVIIASTAKGICHVSFTENEEDAFFQLRLKFIKAVFHKNKNTFHEEIVKSFNRENVDGQQIKLHLKGTSFQIRVWEALLKIPFGEISTYSSVAQNLLHPKAARAVGSAVGANPVALLIPCHRVIRSTGVLGDYHWGTIRKKIILGWESAKAFG